MIVPYLQFKWEMQKNHPKAWDKIKNLPINKKDNKIAFDVLDKEFNTKINRNAIGKMKIVDGWIFLCETYGIIW